MQSSERELSPLEKATQLIESNPDSKAAEVRILSLLIDQHKSILLTGKAGTGKTTLIASVVNKLQRYLIDSGKERFTVDVCALTGLAGSLIPGGIGSTLNSCLGIRINRTRDAMDKFLNVKKREKLKKIAFLVIDEVSMLSAELLTEIDAFLRMVRKRDYFMGGIPTIFSGDFLQLPPVTKDTKEMYAFQASVFIQNVYPNTVYLSTCWRQTDAEFLAILNEIRIGVIGETSCNKLKARDIRLHLKEIEESAVKPTKLYSTNRNVDAENLAELNKLPGESKIFEATHCRGKEVKYMGIIAYSEISPLEKEEITKVTELFDKNTLVPKVLELKVGAQVIYLRSDADPRLKNGSRGVVVRFDDETGMPVVNFIGVGEILLTRVDVPCSTGDQESRQHYSRRQIPIKLAWALTIHKSQGMTLDTVIIYFPDSFCPAQIYVAVSRVKTLAGLYVVGFDPRKIKADPTVLAFYAKLDADVKKSCIERKIELDYPVFNGAPAVIVAQRRGGGQKSGREDDDDEGDGGERSYNRRGKWSKRKRE